MPLRVAHFSDLHYADETLAEVDRCFTNAVDQAIYRNVDVAIITGDTTDHALHAHSPALVALVRQVQRLADHCPVLMLQGTYSHEPPGFLSLFPLIRGKHPIKVADRLQQVALTETGQWIASEDWQFETLPDGTHLLCTCLPTLNRSALAASLGGIDAAPALGYQLAHVLAGYAHGHLAARQADIPVVALSHGTVHGCVTEHGVPMAGADHEFTAEALFGTKATAVMLGHIHKHQAWEKDAQLIAYAGSVGRLHYGEEDDKGFLIWNVDANRASAVLHPTPARRTIDFHFDGPPVMEKLAQFVEEYDIEGAWLRVRWQVLEEERDLVDRARIEELLARAAGVKLEGRIIPIERSRSAGIAREPSIPRQIEQWAALTGTSATDLLRCMDQLRLEHPEAIAARVLQGDLAIANERPHPPRHASDSLSERTTGWTA